ncbi:unnamed protein product, partial [Meganyctiphanes norvegica]
MKEIIFIALILTSYNVLCNRVNWEIICDMQASILSMVLRAHSSNPLGALISGGSLRHRRDASQPPAEGTLPIPDPPEGDCAPATGGGDTQAEGRTSAAAPATGHQLECPLAEEADSSINSFTKKSLDTRDYPGRPTNPTLRKYVPYGYDKYERPPGEEGVNDPLVIYISVKVRDFQKIDETQMELTIEWFVRLFWKDMNLNIPTHLPDGVWENIPPNIIDYVWLPTAYIAHVREITQPTLVIVPESFRMMNTGLIRYSLAVTTRISCPMDFSAYPFDRQICFFTLESYQFDATQVIYTWYKHVVEMGDNIHSNHFDFVFEPVGQVNSTHQHRSFPALSIKITLTRRLSSHLMNTYLPSGLFVIVSWLTFLVPPDLVPGRMVLTITTLLTLVSMFSGINGYKASLGYASKYWDLMCLVTVSTEVPTYYDLLLALWTRNNHLTS